MSSTRARVRTWAAVAKAPYAPDSLKKRQAQQPRAPPVMPQIPKAPPQSRQPLMSIGLLPTPVIAGLSHSQISAFLCCTADLFDSAAGSGPEAGSSEGDDRPRRN